MAITAAEHLADFVCEQRLTGVPGAVLHDAKRLLLNQLTASAAAALQPQGAALLAQARDRHPPQPSPGRAGQAGQAAVWWSDALAPPAQAAAVNAQLLGLLAFGDTHLPSLRRFTAAIVPPLLAAAEEGGHAGRDLLEALALGLEVDIACAGMAERNLGAVVSLCTLAGLDRTALTAALAETGATGPGSFEGLGERWHLHEIALHCRPLPVHALAPVDAVLALRPRGEAREPRLMKLLLSPQAWPLIQGQAAADDLRHCMAAAWLLGQFTTDERDPACLHSAGVRALASRIELLPGAPGGGIESCHLTLHGEDGSARHVNVDAFLGSAAQPLCDSQLSELFRSAADDLVLPRRAGEILHALWGLDRAPDSRVLLRLLRA